MASTKVLIVVDNRMMTPVSASPQFDRALWLAHQICRAHGYTPVVRTVTATATTQYDTLTTDDYAFCIVPRLRSTGSWTGSSELYQFFDGSLGIPTFVLSVNSSGVSAIHDRLGADNPATSSPTSEKLTYGTNTIYSSCIPHPIDSESDVDIFVEDSSGDAVVWRLNGATSSVYVDSSDIVGTQIFTLFPIMLQEAINNGDVQVPPTKANLTFDLDDFPDATTTLADAEALHSVLDSYGIPCTIGVNPALGDTVDSTIYEYISSRTYLNGGVFYPIVHNTTSGFFTGNYATTQTNYVGAGGVPYLQSNINSGITNNVGGYSYFVNNYLSEGAFQALRDYGVRVFRLDENAAQPYGGFVEPIGAYPRTGVPTALFVGSTSSLNLDTSLTVDGATEISRFTLLSGDFIGYGAYGGQVPYMHGTNFYDDHDGGNAPGLRFMSLFAETMAACSDVVQWAHPSQFSYV